MCSFCHTINVGFYVFIGGVKQKNFIQQSTVDQRIVNNIVVIHCRKEKKTYKKRLNTHEFICTELLVS